MSFESIGERSFALTNRQLWLVLVLASYGLLSWQIPYMFTAEMDASDGAIATRTIVLFAFALLTLPVVALIHTICLGWLKNKLIVGLYDNKTDRGFVEAREILKSYFMPVFHIEAISLSLLILALLLPSLGPLFLHIFIAVYLAFIQTYAVLYRCSVRESFRDSFEVMTNHMPAFAGWILAFGGFLSFQLVLLVGAGPGLVGRILSSFVNAYVQIFLFAVAMNFYVRFLGKIRPDFARDRMTIF